MPEMMTQFIKLTNVFLKPVSADNDDFEKADWTKALNEKAVYILFEYTFGAKWLTNQ